MIGKFMLFFEKYKKMNVFYNKGKEMLEDESNIVKILKQ
jgi:hypothetical protein